jgi:DNA-binding transcriptional ArsR family regulator
VSPISVSKGILERCKELGPAIWTYLWLCDHITQLEDVGEDSQSALVNDGNKVKYTTIAEDLGLSPNAVSRHIKILEAAGVARRMKPERVR